MDETAVYIEEGSGNYAGCSDQYVSAGICCNSAAAAQEQRGRRVDEGIFSSSGKLVYSDRRAGRELAGTDRRN